MWVSFFSERHDVADLTQIADDMVKDRLQTVPGVSSIILGGEKRRAIRIWLDPQLLASRGVTVRDVEAVLRTQNLELPSGRVSNTEREFTVRMMGELKTAEAFERLVVRQDENGIVRLSDVGRAEMGVEDMRSRARYKQRPAIGLGVVRQSRANTLSVATGIKEKMEEIRSSLPEGVQFEFPYDESIYVESAVNEVWKTLALAFVLVVLTIFLFLRSVRATFVPALAIPVSIAATFGVLYLLGLTINIFTLLALVLAIGLVVDDAIVVLENIYRHIEKGERPFEAAIKAIKEISFAVIATTLSLVAVFLPLAFIDGLTGRLLMEFAVALAAAVVISSVVALTLSPMAGARLLRPVSDKGHGRLYRFLERRLTNIQARYERGLSWSLRHRKSIIIIGLASLGLSAYFIDNLDTEFLPAEDKGRFMGIVIAPEGATPEYTDRMMQQMEGILAEEEAVRSYFAAVALPFNGPGDAKMGFVFSRLHEDRPRISDVMEGPNGLSARFILEVEGAVGIPILPKAVDVGFSQPYQLVIVNSDLEALDAYTQEVVGRLREEGFVSQPRADFQLNKPELSIEIDRDRASELGVSVEEISRTLQMLLGGDDVSSIKLGGKEYDVIVQMQREERLMPSDIDRVFVRGSGTELVQLSNVVRVRETAGPTVIERYARSRSATINATPAGVTLGEAINRTEAILEETLPAGFTYEWKGEGKNLKESSSDIYAFMFLAILVVYMVLAAQFESFSSPFVVMLSLPLAMVGAFGLLYALSWVNHFGVMFHGWANYAPDAPGFAHFMDTVIPRIPAMNINIFSQVGLILLIGLVTKNSILLVEFANQQMKKGMNAFDAMTYAGKIRLRPILMTSLATIAGILPIAIGLGDASESRRPLGVVAVGGMFTSTLLTLFVIPVMYTIFADFRGRKKKSVATGESREEEVQS